MPYNGKYQKDSSDTYKVSRTKVEMFLNCPRCFYLDRIFGIAPPGIPAFTLNSAVDKLLKKEFDILREKGEAHELMRNYGLDLVPFVHEKMDQWRENFVGVQTIHKPTNLSLFGAVDDIWVDKEGTLYVVDYKATSTEKEIDLNDKWKQAYKRQMEFYQWLLRQNGFKVSNMGYFVYANGRTDNDKFDGRLDFKIEIIEYEGNDSWIEDTLIELKQCLDSSRVSDFSPECELCNNVRRSMEKLPKDL